MTNADKIPLISTAENIPELDFPNMPNRYVITNPRKISSRRKIMMQLLMINKWSAAAGTLALVCGLARALMIISDVNTAKIIQKTFWIEHPHSVME
jgi:hypothetical protein